MRAYRKPRKKNRSLGQRIVSLCKKAVLLVLIITITPVVALRSVAPPTSAYMVQSFVKAWRKGDVQYRVDYRWVPWNRISPSMKIAVIAAEDQRFLQHHGFDFDSIFNAVQDRLDGQRLRGASTISQQVAKNLFLWSGRSYFRKLLEAYFALLIEMMWPKRRILEIYLNTAEFGPGIYGVSSAAHRFYGKLAERLTNREAASLAAVLPSPRHYSVRHPSSYVESRREWILSQMQRLGGPSHLRSI